MSRLPDGRACASASDTALRAFAIRRRVPRGPIPNRFMVAASSECAPPALACARSASHSSGGILAATSSSSKSEAADVAGCVCGEAGHGSF
eukprot:6194096-Pleurochrysis_carterae.AAC.1